MLGTYERLRVHVLESDRVVIRALRRKFVKAALTRANRGARHKIIREILSRHAQARGLYLKVMSGRL